MDDDESFTDNQFATIYNLYHEGHQQGTHDREVVEFAGEGDPLAALELEQQHSRSHGINQMVVSALSGKIDAPDHVKYSQPYWWAQGYKHGRGGDYDYTGFVPAKHGVTYSPPKREDPMNRNGPW